MPRLFHACAVVFALSVGAAACSQPQTASDAGAADLAVANAQLEGDWRLVRYQPATALEPSLQALLNMQLTTMTVSFDGQHMVGQSPSLRMQRTYRITQAAGPTFTIRATDETGVGYEAYGEFRGPDEVLFHGTTSPWNGMGVLQRVKR